MDKKIIPTQATATSGDKPRFDGEERHAGGLSETKLYKT